MNRIKKLFISALVLMLLLIGCTTTGSVNTYKMYDISPSSNTYLGEVRAEKNVWHWFFSTGNTQVEAYNVALAEAKKVPNRTATRMLAQMCDNYRIIAKVKRGVYRKAAPRED